MAFYVDNYLLSQFDKKNHFCNHNLGIITQIQEKSYLLGQ
jgi:hypothetical protein